MWLVTVLRRQFQRLKPLLGELVAVKFLGRKISQTGNEYSSFKVTLQRDEGDVDWDSLGAESGPDEW